MKKASIIIPCYNAVQYIPRCMDTLVKQTIGIDNLELILVNDASTDDTFNVLCEWEERYPESILVINCKKTEDRELQEILDCPMLQPNI